MQDLRSKLEKLLAEATDCDIIGNLATDKAKRDLFRKLASDLRTMAQDIQTVIAMKSRAEGAVETESEVSAAASRGAGSNSTWQ